MAVFVILPLNFLQYFLQYSYVQNAEISNFISNMRDIWIKSLTDVESNYKYAAYIEADFVSLPLNFLQNALKVQGR